MGSFISKCKDLFKDSSSDIINEELEYQSLQRVAAFEDMINMCDFKIVKPCYLLSYNLLNDLQHTVIIESRFNSIVTTSHALRYLYEYNRDVDRYIGVDADDEEKCSEMCGLINRDVFDPLQKHNMKLNSLYNNTRFRYELSNALMAWDNQLNLKIITELNEWIIPDLADIIRSYSGVRRYNPSGIVISDGALEIMAKIEREEKDEMER